MWKRKKAGSTDSPNLLDFTPVRLIEWEQVDDERVVLLVPKFTHSFWVRWLVPLLRRPNFRVKLDERGSLVWLHCDGHTTVGEIGERLHEQFGEEAEPLYERLVVFIRMIKQQDFIKFE